VKKRFPDPESKLLIGCSDGRAYSMDALMALDEEGYTNIVGLKVGSPPLDTDQGHTEACTCTAAPVAVPGSMLSGTQPLKRPR